MTVISLLWAGWLGVQSLNFESLGSGVSIFSGNFYISSISTVYDTFLCIIGAILLCGWTQISVTVDPVDYDRKSTLINPMYNILVIFSIIGSTILISSSNFLSIFVALELQSLAVYVLAGLYKDSYTSTGSSLKYFFLGAFSTAIILLGVALIYSSTGNFTFENIILLNSTIGNDEIFSEINLGFSFITIGLLFKIAAAPFHNWAPDVYDGTPTIVTLWISTIPKISIIIFIINIAWITNLNDTWYFLLMLSGIISLIIGAVLGQSQNRIKRLLAYSTISHVGFILIGMANGSYLGIESLLFYVLSYSVTNATVFLVILALGYADTNCEGEDKEILADFKGVFWHIPFISVSLALCLFSIAGIPPIIGFIAKAKILQATLGSPYSYVTLLAVVVSIISAVYYLKVIRTIFIYRRVESDYNRIIFDVTRITSVHSVIISILTLILTLFLLNPTYLLNTTSLLASNFY